MRRFTGRSHGGAWRRGQTNGGEATAAGEGGLSITDSRPLAAVMLALRAVPEAVLGSALRDLRRRRPEVFERLGVIGAAAVVIAPTDLPIAFRLSPGAGRRQVQLIRRDDPRPCAARISGPLALLLEVVDGASDADAAFFSRRLMISGETETVVGLHNTLEAAELTPSDLFGVPAPLRGVADRAARRALTWLRRLEAGG